MHRVRNPQLAFDCIFRFTAKRQNTQMLLDSFAEQFNLPRLLRVVANVHVFNAILLIDDTSIEGGLNGVMARSRL